MRDIVEASIRHGGHPTAALLLAVTLAGCGADPEVTTVACDLNTGPCRFADGRGQLEFSPRPLPLMQPIAVRLDYPFAVPSVRIDFQGTTMDMGFNQATLRRDADGVYRGTALLPVCAGGAMRWRADLLADDGAAKPIARFEFDTSGEHRQTR